MKNGMDEGMDKGKSPPPPKGTKKALTPKTFQRPRGGEAKSVSSLMPDIGRAAFRKFGFVQSSVVSRWDEIVGARYAAVSAPEAIRFPIGKKSDGTLELTVEGAHATMIQHVLPEIIERVNRFFGYGAVAQVKVRQGPVAKPKLRQPTAAPMLKPVPMELGDSLREIGDPELFAVLESLAKSLAKGGE